MIEPENLDSKALFAVDQFLMRGGSVVLATAPYKAVLATNSLRVDPVNSGMEEWLAHQGVSFDASLVMDPQNAAFPAPITRQVGGLSFQEMTLLDYPYFPDIRGAGLAQDHPILANLPQATLTWPSPIEVADASEGTASVPVVTTLLESSAGTWLSTDTDVMPKYDPTGASPFTPVGNPARQTLAVMLEGQFQSFFAGKKSPLLEASEPAAEATQEDAEASSEVSFDAVIERSAQSARLVVVASNDFLADQFTQLIGSAEGTYYTNTAQLMANIIDFSLEDQSLVSIRSRGQFARTLPPMEVAEQRLIEYFNYALALVGIGLVMLWQWRRRKSAARTYGQWLAEAGA